MGNMLYGLGFLAIMIVTDVIRYKHEDIIDQIFALDSIDPSDKLRPNITLEGFFFIQQVLVCLVSYTVSYFGKGLNKGEHIYEQDHSTKNVEMSALYQRVETTQQQRQRHSMGHKKIDQNSSRLKTYQNQTTSPALTCPIPLQYSILLGILYFIQIKTYSYAPSKMNINIVVLFKSLNLFLLLILMLCVTTFEITFSLVGIKLTYEMDRLRGVYPVLLAFLLMGSSIVFYALDDLFRMAMVDSNRSLGLVFDTWAALLFAVSLLMDIAIFGTLMTIKSHYQQTSPTQLVVQWLQFSLICFGLNLISNGTLTSTLELIYKYPGSPYFFLQLSIVSYLQYFTFSYTLLNYPVLVLVTIVARRPSLKYLYKHFVNEPSGLNVFYWLMAIGGLLFVLELVKSKKNNPENQLMAPGYVEDKYQWGEIIKEQEEPG